MHDVIRPGAGLLALAAIVPLALPAAAQAAPDLTARINSVSPQPAAAGSKVSVRTELRNQGTSPANLNRKRANNTVIHMARWYFRENGTGPDKFIMAMSMLGRLNPGQAKTVSPQPEIPKGTKPGRHAICVVIDPENRVRESNERNNRSCTRIRVSGRGMVRPRSRDPEQSARTPGKAAKCPGTLPAPRHISPRNGSKFNHYPRTTRFRWSPVRNAKSYAIEVDCMHCCVQGKWCSDVGKTWHVMNGLNSPNYAHNFVGAQPGRWRVWAVDACGKKGKVSGWWEFEYTR